MKVGIIGGAGGVGSAIAFHLAISNLVDEVALIDVKQNLATAHALDVEQAIADSGHARITFGGFDLLEGCGIVIQAASGQQHNLLATNLQILEAIAAPLVRHCPGAVILMASNPIDVLGYRLCQMTGLPARQFIGFSRDDTLRFRINLAAQLNVDVRQVQAFVIGEHGPAMVPLFSSVTVGGQCVELSAAQRAAVLDSLRGYLVRYEALKAGRTACWTTAVGVTHMVRSIVGRTGEVQAASVILDGQYGLSGLSLGAPVVLGPEGVTAIKMLPLAADETAALQSAAAKVRTAIANCSAAK